MLSTIALTLIPGIGSSRARHLIQAFGSAEAVFSADEKTLLSAGPIGTRVLEGRNIPGIKERAEKEIEFIEQNGITAHIYGKTDYPRRLLDCPDAPTILYQLGSLDLNQKHILSIVGTRQCTQYGRDMVHRFVSDLCQLVPDIIITSGLALGIDVESHKSALENNIPTVGVVAHSLDRIYPYQHRDIARQMIHSGGDIVTEYVSGTQPERGGT